MTGRTDHSAARRLGWLGALLALYLAVPIVAFAIRLAGSPDRGFSEPGLWDAAATSAEAATVATALVALTGIPLAFWLARSRSRLTALVGALVQLPLALPPVMSGIVLIYVVGPYTALGRLTGGALTDSLAGVVIAQSFVAAPFLVIAARSGFEAVDPTLDDLAATLGHRPLGRFLRVDLAVARSSIRAGLLLTWLRAVGEYGATVLLAYHPYTLPVFTYVQFSSTGIPTTQAPTALAIGAAAAVLGLACVRRPARWSKIRRAPVRLPEPVPPAPAPAQRVAFDLDLRVGEFRLRAAYTARTSRLAILGPSGAGKSLTLRALAGLLPAAGRATVLVGGDNLSPLPPERRVLGLVPQANGLIPGRSVWRQVTFGCGCVSSLAAWWLDRLHIAVLADRLPHELSGGQRQRVSLAQALAHRPRVVLLDEPFSALDSPVRRELRRELRRLQRDAGLSTVLVTHDAEEAALLADEIVVLDEGRILQAGSRSELFACPASVQVARLLGLDNVAEAVVVDGSTLRCGRLDIPAPTDLPAGTRVLWQARPVLDVTGDYPAEVRDVAELGTHTVVAVQPPGGPELAVRCPVEAGVEPGDRVRIRLADVRAWLPDPVGQPVPA